MDNNFILSDAAKGFYRNKEILITGGTGSLGKTLVRLLCQHCKPRGIRVYSRDELKQWNMQSEMARDFPDAHISYLIGDVRDAHRLHRAMENVNAVIHTAAMKQVPTCENNPMEAIQTNVHGAENVINAALDCEVTRVMNVSTDKAVYPVNLYGATKMVAENLFTHSNVYAQGGRATLFSSCRYGNVLASRGSVAQVFRQKAALGEHIPVTHADMTRFWITLPAVAQFLLNMLHQMQGAEIFIPTMKSMSIVAMAEVMAPDNIIIYTGIRKGEKIHECLIAREESRFSSQGCDYFRIRPLDVVLGIQQRSRNTTLSSDDVTRLRPEELLEMLEE